MHKTYATLCYGGETVQTELTQGDCANYPVISYGGVMENAVKACHFAPYEPGAMAGEIMPVDAEHPANARLIWWWIDREERPVITAAFSVKEFPAGVL